MYGMNENQPESNVAVAPVETPAKVRGKYATKDTSTYPMVVFVWSDGTRSDVDVTAFPEAVQQQAAMHGFSQKLGDSYASAKSLDEAKEKFVKQYTAIANDGWKGRAESAAPTEEPVELLAQAIVLTLQEAGKQPELAKILEQVKAADRKTRNLWRNDPEGKVAYHLARLRNAGKAPESTISSAFGY